MPGDQTAPDWSAGYSQLVSMMGYQTAPMIDQLDTVSWRLQLDIRQLLIDQQVSLSQSVMH